MPITKTKTIKKPVRQNVKPSAGKPSRYFEAVGRRKTAIARVRLLAEKEKGFSVNDKSLAAYFPIVELQKIAISPLDVTGCFENFGISARVKGSGLHSQAEAIRHAVSRTLILFNPELRGQLKKAGFLTRDPRMRERKKPGLKRARKAPQWAKR